MTTPTRITTRNGGVLFIPLPPGRITRIIDSARANDRPTIRLGERTIRVEEIRDVHPPDEGRAA